MDKERFDPKTIEDGKAKLFKMSSKIPTVVKSGSTVYEIVDKDGNHFDMYVGCKKDSHIKLNEELKSVNPLDRFYLGKKGDEFVVKPVHETNEEKKPLPWEKNEDESKAADGSRLTFGKHDEKGAPKKKSERKSDTEDDDKEVSKSANVSDAVSKDDAKNNMPVPGEYKATEMAKSAVLSRDAADIFDSNVTDYVCLSCPHCNELMTLGFEVSPHPVSASKAREDGQNK